MRRTHRIGWDLTDIVEDDVLPAAVDAISVTIRTEIMRGDKDGLGGHQLAPRVGPTWRCGGARGEIQRLELDTISCLDTQTKKGSVNHI